MKQNNLRNVSKHYQHKKEENGKKKAKYIKNIQCARIFLKKKRKERQNIKQRSKDAQNGAIERENKK